MLRQHPAKPPRLKYGFPMGVLAFAALLALGNLRSAADETKPAPAKTEPRDQAKTDLQGDPLPVGARARMGTLRWRHGDTVTFVAFSQDGRAVVTASQDQIIRLWDRASGKEIRRFKGPAAKNPPVAQPFQPGGMVVWGNVGLGQLALALSPDSKILAAAFPNIGIQIWDVASGKELRLLKLPAGGANTLLFAPGGKILVAHAANRTTYLLDTETGNELRQIKGPQQQRGMIIANINGVQGGGTGLGISADGKTLATGISDFEQNKVVSYIRLSEMDTGKEIRRIDTMPDGVSALAYSPSGNILAHGSGNTILLWDGATSKEIRKINSPGGATALVFAPDGNTLAAKGRDQVIRLWQTETGKEIRQLGEPPPGPGAVAVAVFMPFFLPPATRDFAFSPDGKVVAAAAGQIVCLWDAGTGKEVPLAGGHRGPVSALAVAPDGKTLLSRGADNVIYRWDAATGKQLGRLKAPPGTSSAVFAPDGRTVALGALDGTIRLIDVDTGKEMHQLKGHANGTAAIAFPPSGKVLASRGGIDNTIRLFDVAKGHELRQIAVQADAPTPFPGGGFGFAGPRGQGLAFMPDGRTVVAHVAANGPVVFRNPNNGQPAPPALPDTLRLWDVVTGKEVRRIALPKTGLLGFAVSPDGRVLATENADQTISLWEIAGGKERGRLGSPAPAGQSNTLMVGGMPGAAFTGTMGVSSSILAYSPDGGLLAANGPDHSIRVWDVTAGKEVGRFKGHSGSITAAAFAPDGQTLASGSRDTTILVWDLAGLKREASLPTLDLQPKEVEALWTDLAGDEAGQAFRSLLRLAQAPKRTLAFLGAHLRPAVPVDAKMVDRLIADLDSERFQARQKAVAALAKLGELAVPALQKVLTSDPSLETRRRVEPLLEKLTGGTLSAEQVRLVRALEVLEKIGTPEARELLVALAQGAPGALATRQAQAVLERLPQRAALPAP